jgi:hypothetical protein
MQAREAQPEARQAFSERNGEPARRESEAPGAVLAAPGRMTLPATVLQLQRQVGNRQVRRMVARFPEASVPAGPEGPEGEISPEVEQSIARSRSNGRPLDGEVRGRMEASFGTDFGGVRVHTGSEADRLNRQLSARAFTTGSDVFFRDGEYRPGSSGGRELIAHELTHVVQQQGTVQTSRLTLGPPGDRFEQEADAAARRVMRDEEVPVASGAGGVARSIQREDAGEAQKPVPLTVDAGTFDQVAETFGIGLRDKYPLLAGAGVVIINGANVGVYDGYGQLVAGRSFTLKRPSGLGRGVYVQFADSDLRLHKVLRFPDGSWDQSPAQMSGDIDFRRDVEPRAAFDNAFKQFKGAAFFIVPGVREDLVPEEDLPERPIEERPEFMKVNTHRKAELDAFPGAVVPLTPQVTAVGSTGQFYCRLEKTQGYSLVDDVTNAAERVNFRWEVLKLDPKLLVEETDKATRWESTQTRFKTKARHIRDDEKTMLGEQGASVPEKVYRSYLKQQMAVPRRILGYGGEAVLSIMHSLLDNHDRNIEDYISHMFEAPGNYFVRCLATPVGGSRQRATTVAGVMVSVFDIKEVAAESLDTAAELKEKALTGLEQIEPELERLRTELAAETRAERRIELQVQIRMTELRRPFFEAVQRASGDAYAVRVAELEYVRARLAYLTGKEAPVFQGTQSQLGLRKQIEGLKAEEKRLAGQVKRVDSKLGDGVVRTGFMRAMLVDDTSGGSQEVLLTIGERQYVSTDRLEVVIGDVTSEKGRRFTGMGSGFLGRGRSDAWHEAMRDLQRNLGKGRGWLSYEAPEPYASLNEGLDNPLQLQVAELDQMKELLDDAAHAATLTALLLAPFTGGASLAIVAVLAPFQIGSSLYNIVNRAMYDDLELDVDAIGSFVDIATLGLGKFSTAGKLATRGVRIVATSSRIAVQLLDGGMYVVFTYSTYMELMKDYPGETPTEARVRRLKTLLDYFSNASIPVAHHIWPPGTAPHGKAPHDGPDAHPGHHEETTPKEHAPAEHAPVEKPPAKPAIPKEYEKALAGAPRKVPPVFTDELPKDTVRIRYEVVDGVITKMWMEIGHGTKASLVKQHVATAKDMARYMGLSGQVRKVYKQIVEWLTKNPVAGPESRAWEAEREVRKLQRIIDEQFAAYDKAVRDDNVVLRDELRRELDNLEAQLHEHARDVDRFDATGRGVVAAEGRSDRPTFSAETSRRDAFRKLGGFDTRAGKTGLEPASDLRRFADALVREKIVDSPEALARQMPDPKGLSHEAVLDALKAPNVAKLVDRASDAKRLRSLASYREARQAGAVPARALHEAAAAEAKRIADLLPEADRAAFLDAWKAKNPEPAAPAVPAPKVEPIGAEALREDLRPEPAKAPEAAAEASAVEPARAAQEWLDRLRSELPESAQKRLDGMARGKTPAETRALVEHLGGKDYLVAGAREAEARGAAQAASPGRARETKERFGADADFLSHPDVAKAIAVGDAARVRSEMAAEMAGRSLLEGKFKDVPGARALRGVRIVREQSHATVAEARKALNAKSQTETGKPYAGVIYERNGKVYTVSTDIDVLVIQDVPGQPSKILRFEEVKSGEKDTPGEAGGQLKKAEERLAEIGAGDKTVRLELADGTDITATIDAQSAAGAEKATRSTLDNKSKKFDEHLDVTSRDLLKAAEEMLGEQRKKLPAAGSGGGGTGKRPRIRDVEPIDGDQSLLVYESEWILATNAAGADVFKSLTRIISLSSHVEGIVVYGQRTGKKVTIITGYHGSADGGTRPEKKFAVDDAKYYKEKYPDVEVIDASDMTHDQRLDLIDKTAGVVVVATCYGACAKPSAAATPPPPPARPHGEHMESSILLDPEMLKKLSESINTRPRASYSVMIEHHSVPRYGLVETVNGVNVRRAMSDHEATAGNAPLGEPRPGLEGFLEDGIHAVKASDTTLGAIILLEAEKVLGKKGDLWFSPSRELAERFAHDFDELIRAVKSVVDSYSPKPGRKVGDP